ncbi:MAG: calcium-binding protein [Herbaspirillum sp.]
MAAEKDTSKTGNGKLYDVTHVTITHGPLAGRTIPSTTNTQTGEVSHHWLEADGSRSRGNVAANGNVSFLDRNDGALHIYRGGDYVGSFGFDHVSEQIGGVNGRYIYDPASGVITSVTASVGGAPISGFSAMRHSADGRSWSQPSFGFLDRQAAYDADHAAWDAFGKGLVDRRGFENLVNASTSFLVNDANRFSTFTDKHFDSVWNPHRLPTFVDDHFGLLHWNPLGAFYESSSPGLDTAASIADKTFLVMDDNGVGLTVAELAARDADGDGRLGGAELDGLRAVSDLREDGMFFRLTPLRAALLQAGVSSLSAGDYAIHAAGKVRLPDVAQYTASASFDMQFAPMAEPSCWEQLNRSEQYFDKSYHGVIFWRRGQIRVSCDQQSMIGTDGNDNFDINYYANHDYSRPRARGPKYFNLSLVKNFYAGPGDDLVGGSERNDKIWGGSGNDRMWGYGGGDILYGEEGDDVLHGGAGNDQLHGGAGNDLLLGGLGHDRMWGGIGNDEFQGGDGDDFIYGEAGDDRLFGGAGSDRMWGGAGDDLLVGFTADNDSKQSLNPGESDDDFLYGGAGNDTLLGGPGNDYLDGGAGADQMEGGVGDDIYIVNSVNDVVLEHQDEGYDTVVSSTNTILGANIEELRLVEGYTINGTGNSLDNRIIGNSRDNILDGVTGADVMIGGLGNDTYYVDNAGDQVVELAGEGIDTVNASISHTLAEHVENLSLLDFSKAERGIADGAAILVYGYPKAFELDYMQGDAVPGYRGTCALTAIANLSTQASQPLTEAQVVRRAIHNQWTVTDPAVSDSRRGSSNYAGQRALLDSYGIRNGLLMGYDEQALANLLMGGRGVIVALDSRTLWDDHAAPGRGKADHVVAVTGVACDAQSGAIAGFYIADSGRGKVSDMTRYVPIASFRRSAGVADGYSIYTIEPIKLWEENIDGAGNALDNVITGNRGDNVLTGGKGNDTLVGGRGNDTYVFARGDGCDTIVDNDATPGHRDVLRFTDVHQDNLWLTRVDNDLRISVMGGSDRITVKDWYAGGGADNQIECIETADGLTLYNTDVEQLVQAMAAFAPPAAAQTRWTRHQDADGRILLAALH